MAYDPVAALEAALSLPRDVATGEEAEVLHLLSALRLELDRLRNESEVRRQALAEREAQVRDLGRVVVRWREEAQRWADRTRDLENRLRHAVDTLAGRVSPTTVAELRRHGGAEPLDPWTVMVEKGIV